MFIDINRLRDQGFDVDVKDEGVYIHPKFRNPDAEKHMHKLCDALFLKPREIDDLTCAIDDIIVITAIRR